MAVQGEVFEATARTFFNGVDEVNNVYQFQMDSLPAITDEEAIEDIIEIIEDVFLLLKAFMSILVVARDVTVRRLTPPTVFGAFPYTSFTGGTATADATPPGVAAQMYFNTAVPRVILRKFFGIMTETVVSVGGNMTSPLKDALALVGVDLLNPLVEAHATWRYGYFSPKTSSFVLPTGATVPAPFSYQRRRKPGVGS